MQMSRLELVLVSAIEMKRAKKPRTIMRPHFKMLPKKKTFFKSLEAEAQKKI